MIRFGGGEKLDSFQIINLIPNNFLHKKRSSGSGL